MTNRIHESNGRVPTAGPLEAAAKAEKRLCDQMDELANRLDKIATTDLAAAQERLAEAAANLAERVEAAKTFVDATVGRVAALLAGLADLFSDDVTKADEVNPPPLTQEQWDAQVPPLNRLAAMTPPVTSGPPDDEDDPEDDIGEDDDEYCPVKAAEPQRVTEEDFDADNYLPPEVKEAVAEAIRREEESEAVALKTADVKGEAFNVHLKDAFDQSNRNLDAPKKPAGKRRKK